MVSLNFNKKNSHKKWCEQAGAELVGLAENKANSAQLELELGLSLAKKRHLSTFQVTIYCT